MNEPPWQKGPKSIAVGCPLGIETRRRGDVIPSAIYVPVPCYCCKDFKIRVECSSSCLRSSPTGEDLITNGTQIAVALSDFTYSDRPRWR
jgi:hypothetical protein